MLSDKRAGTISDVCERLVRPRALLLFTRSKIDFRGTTKSCPIQCEKSLSLESTKPLVSVRGHNACSAVIKRLSQIPCNWYRPRLE